MLIWRSPSCGSTTATILFEVLFRKVAFHGATTSLSNIIRKYTSFVAIVTYFVSTNFQLFRRSNVTTHKSSILILYTMISSNYTAVLCGANLDTPRESPHSPPVRKSSRWIDEIIVRLYVAFYKNIYNGSTPRWFPPTLESA